jgi:hypothetical protein
MNFIFGSTTAVEKKDNVKVLNKKLEAQQATRQYWMKRQESIKQQWPNLMVTDVQKYITETSALGATKISISMHCHSFSCYSEGLKERKFEYPFEKKDEKNVLSTELKELGDSLIAILKGEYYCYQVDGKFDDSKKSIGYSASYWIDLNWQEEETATDV